MTLVDAYALVAFVADEPAADAVERVLRAGGAEVVAINLAEAVDVCGRNHGIAADGVRNALEPLFLGGVLRPRSSGEREAWRAAEIRSAHYHRKDCPLSLADCFLLAHALEQGDEIATSDPHVAAVARGARLGVTALPDRAGVLP